MKGNEMKLEAGYWYEIKCTFSDEVEKTGTAWWNGSFWSWIKNGPMVSIDYKITPCCKLAPELPLGFALLAGRKYCTVKTDGSAGPVVELERSNCMRLGFLKQIPFQCRDVADLFFRENGEGFYGDGHEALRITAPYVESTLSERLAKWRKDWIEDERKEPDEALATIIADLKKLEGVK